MHLITKKEKKKNLSQLPLIVDHLFASPIKSFNKIVRFLFESLENILY